MNKLEQLKKYTTIVADTGAFQDIEAFHPTDATTNPSLILTAASQAEYQDIIEKSISSAKKQPISSQALREYVMDEIFVNFGLEILKIVPGRVSTEVDARLSFDIEGSLAKARRFIQMYESAGVPRDRILIKLSSTWEGIKAAEQLENEGIHCNMTLIFSKAQAIACAQSKATLISPFVGRILDWHKKIENRNSYAPAEDPGVISVTEIYNYYKKFEINTQIMGASFRNVDEIIELCGCDLLTIAPKLLAELQTMEGPVTRKLDPATSRNMEIQKIELDEKGFRWMLCENAMATEKLYEGIRNFGKDAKKLEDTIMAKF